MEIKQKILLFNCIVLLFLTAILSIFINIEATETLSRNLALEHDEYPQRFKGVKDVEAVATSFEQGNSEPGSSEKDFMEVKTIHRRDPAYFIAPMSMFSVINFKTILYTHKWIFPGSQSATYPGYPKNLYNLAGAQQGQCANTNYFLHQLFMGQNPFQVNIEKEKTMNKEMNKSYKNKGTFKTFVTTIEEKLNPPPEYLYEVVFAKSKNHHFALILDYTDSGLYLLNGYIDTFGLHWWMDLEDQLSSFVNLDYQTHPIIIETRDQLGSVRLLDAKEFKNYFPNALGFWDCFDKNVKFAENETIRKSEEQKCTDSYYARDITDTNFELTWLIYDEQKQKTSNDDLNIISQNIEQFLNEAKTLQTASPVQN